MEVDGGQTAISYYDAEGRRVRWQTPALGGDGDYFYDTAGRYIGIMNNVTGGFHSAEVYAGAMHLGTYTSQFNFSHGDQLGTIHAWSTASGALERTCTGLPGACPERSRRGDAENCSGTFASTLYYTGKEDDYAYNLDYFGARYYAPSIGRPDAFTDTGRSALSEPDRFMSPDWSAKVEPVPYAKLADPQSLNLYAYVLDNPTTSLDLDGHACEGSSGPNARPVPPPTQTSSKSLAQRQRNEIAGQINHETLGMKNSKAANVSLGTAEDEIAHVRLNGIKKWGSNAKAQKYASLVSAIEKGPGYKLSRQAVEKAIMEDLKGIDPTHGAIFYNMRTVGQFKHGGRFQPAFPF